MTHFDSQSIRLRASALVLLLAGGFATLVWSACVFSADGPAAGEKIKLPYEKTIGKLELVALLNGPMPTGVTVAHDGRVFVNFPRWGDKVEYTVGEVKKDETVPFPSLEANRWDKDKPSQGLLSVQSVVVDPKNRLWLLDTGSVNFGPVTPGAAKLVGVDLATNKVFKTIHFAPEVALEKSYLNDIRFDLKRGKEGLAFITDSSGETPGLIIVDLETGQSWRRLHQHASTLPKENFLPIVEGQPLMERPEKGKAKHLKIGSDGIAISADGKKLYYCPLSSRHLYSVSVEALADPKVMDAEVAKTVIDLGDRGFASDGLESDDKGRLYLTNYEHNAILRWTEADGYETILHDPLVLWPDTLSVARDGYLYFTANQLHRQAKFQFGKDQREKPYSVMRTKIDAGPVLLK